MSSLEEYIERIKEETKGFEELDIIRYVYWNLGERLSFNLDYSFGNKKEREAIYRQSATETEINKGIEENVIICKTSAAMLERILTQLGIKIKTVVAPNDYKKCPHVYNVITTKDGEEYIADLQDDLESIQSHSFTERFGKSTQEGQPPVISRQEIEQSDRRLGRVSDDYYYADEYIYLLKQGMSYFSDEREKVKFALENLEFYDRPEMKYAERKWHHEGLIKKLFTEKEQRKIQMIDCYIRSKQGKDYQNCIVFQTGKQVDIYMFLPEYNQYRNITMDNLVWLVQHGLIPLQKIPGLKSAYMNKVKADKKGKSSSDKGNSVTRDGER